MTILFYEDWQRYGGIPDWTTSNQTAIRVATALKRMDIENHAFILALYDQDLQGVDPFDPDLPLEMQAKVTREFGRNLWYALRECIRVPPVAGIEEVPFKFHRANVALCWLYLNRIFNINVIARQRGKTMAVICLFTWLLNSRSNLTISSITKDDDLRTKTIRDFKKVYDGLPYYLKFRDKTDSKNNEEFTVNALKNIFKMAVPSQSPKRAYMVGRGLTSTTTWSDESCFSPNIRISLGACIASGTYAREEAERKGEPSGIILTTTAGLLDDRDAGYIYELSEGATIFNDALYDAENKADLVFIIRNNNVDRRLRTYTIYNHLQLGVTNERQLEAMQMSAQGKKDAERDFLNIWNRGSSSHPLDESILKIMNNSLMEPLYSHLTGVSKYLVNWYVDKEDLSVLAEYPLVLGLDPSEGIGVDGMSIVITSAITGEVLGTADQSLLSLPSYIKWLYDTFFKPFPYLVGVIENRSTGQAIIDGLCELMIADGINPFLRLFNTVVNDMQSPAGAEMWNLVKPGKFRPADNKHLQLKKYFGFKTAGSGLMARSALYGEVFYAASSDCGNTVKDRGLITQISALIQKDNRINHPQGGHDDRVIAWLLTQWFLRMAKNLHIYNIQSTQVLSQTSIEPQSMEDLELIQYRERYKELLEELRYADNSYVQRRLTLLLRNMELEQPLLQEEPATLQQILDSMKERQRIDNATNRHMYGGAGAPVLMDMTVGR